MSNPKSDGATPSDSSPSGRAWFALLALSVAYTVSFIDRQAISLLAEPIRRDLALSDIQLGLLQGVAFAAVYVLAGLPIGRLADQYNRRNIIAIGVIFWSFMTGLCGVAGSFAMLLVYRAGVGIGEAALSPAAYSMMSDYFGPKHLPAAMSIYSLAPSIGSGLALILGGALLGFAGSADVIDLPLLAPIQPWRAIFLILGAVGVAVIALLLFVAEPPRRGRGESHVESKIGFSQTFRYLRPRMGTVVAQLVGMALIGLVSYAAMTWYPAMMMRTFGESASRAGLMLGPLMIVGSLIGNLGGAWGAMQLYKRGHRAPYIKWVTIVASMITVVGVICPLLPSVSVTYVAIGVVATLNSAWNGAAMAALHLAMPNEMRGQATALALLGMNLLGLSLGPIAVAALTQYYFQDPQSLHFSIAIVCGIAGAAATVVLALSWRNYAKESGVVSSVGPSRLDDSCQAIDE